MSNEAQSYDTATIRQLLLAAFTSEELRRFCYDRPTFRPILSRFGSKRDRYSRTYHRNPFPPHAHRHLHTPHAHRHPYAARSHAQRYRFLDPPR